MLVSVQAQADVAGEELVLLLGEHGIDLFGGRPGSGAMFLSVPCPALPGLIQADAHDVEPGAGEDAHQAVLRPANPEGVLQGLGQPGQDIRQAVSQALTAAQGVGKEQSRPNNGDIEEQPDQQTVVLLRVLQQRSSPRGKHEKSRGRRRSSGTPGGEECLSAHCQNHLNF